MDSKYYDIEDKGKEIKVRYYIEGGKELHGSVNISGAKNAAVAIIPATVLCDEVCTIENVPDISDVNIIIEILQQMGAKVRYVAGDHSRVVIDPRGITGGTVDASLAELVRKMRASYYLLGALLGRFGNVSETKAGGCDFCDRPIDLHLMAFRAFGAKCTTDNYGAVTIESTELHGAEIAFDTVSVGATINAILAAVRIEGLTTIRNAAREPHVVDVANFLNSMGAHIKGAGTDTIKIEGVDRLHGCTYSIIPDQIEAGTYMAAVAAAGGDVTIKGVTPEHLRSITKRLIAAGVEVYEQDGDDGNGKVRVVRKGDLKACNVTTEPHPGFPTDMQPQITAMLTFAKGQSRVTEAVWEDRFSYQRYLVRMGANIFHGGKTLYITGTPNEMHCAEVRALDLRAGAAMVVAALAVPGTTIVKDAQYIERGYERMLDKLGALGVKVTRKETIKVAETVETSNM